MSKPYKPSHCKRCGSTSVIPVVEGDPVGWVGHLVFRELISVCGSFQIADGCIIWECGDCHADFSDPEWVCDMNNKALVRTYNEVLNRIFDEREPVTSQTQEDQIKGRFILRQLARKVINYSDTECFLKGNGNDIWLEIGADSIFKKVVKERYELQYHFALLAFDETNDITLEIRVDKEPAKVSAKKIDDKTIHLTLA